MNVSKKNINDKKICDIKTYYKEEFIKKFLKI